MPKIRLKKKNNTTSTKYHEKKVIQKTSVQNKDGTPHNQKAAEAPYNFVQLNKSIVEVENSPDMDCYYPDRHSGHIDCTLETLTPLYVRDTLTKDEMKSGIEAKDNCDFFSPGNRIRIPGSSLRGIIRTLVEIATWSKFQFL